MDDIPIELLQEINDQLEFFDQIKFKSISKLFYDKITIKQYIPNILIVRNFSHGHGAKYYINLKELHIIYKKFHELLSEEYHNIIVIIPNKQLDYYDSVLMYKKLSKSMRLHDLTTLIKLCLERTNQILELEDIL